MFGARALEDFLPTLLADPAVARAIIEAMPGIAPAERELATTSAAAALSEAGIRVLIAELVANGSTVVRQIHALGTAAGEFPVSVMPYGPVFWVQAPDFDDIGYFASEKGAVSAAASTYEPYITAYEESLEAGVEEDESDTDNEDGTDPGCPYCGSRESCEHHLLMVELVFRSACGGALSAEFDRAWNAAYEAAEERGTDVDEAEEFERCLEAVSSLADGEHDVEFEGGPGQSSTYRSFFCSSKQRVEAAVAAFNGAGG